jgi:uncharacterized membrane protein
MTRNHSLWLGALLVLISACISAWYYPHLPEQIPTHWNFAGQINGYSPKLWGVFQMPLFLAFMWLLLLILPRISPKGYRLDQFLDSYGAVLIAIMAALLILNFGFLRAALHPSSTPNSLVFLTLGMVLVIMGNYMGKFRKNFFIGVRTPWTLASDEVWARTHRLTGWLFIIAGLALMVNSVLGAHEIVVLIIILSIVAVVPIAYSYVLYSRIEGFGSNDSS